MSKTPSNFRARDLGIFPGVLPPGMLNAITDVQGIRVGHFTLIEGEDIRTGATAILPHRGNIYQHKVPAGIVVGNGFGKLIGYTQIVELGEIETPIVLTNTLSAPQAANALIAWTLGYSGNENVVSINPVVGETNDHRLNNIRKLALTTEMIIQAVDSAQEGPVLEGSVGAGTGTVAFGWKGGIGTSSRKLPPTLGGYTLGVLVQTNYGGIFQIMGVPIGKELGQYYLKNEFDEADADGSIIIVIATDAPLSDRNLTRLAQRGLAGLSRTGSSMSNGSGDYVIAFSTNQNVIRTPERRMDVFAYPEVPNEKISPLFQAAIECTEEAIYNSLFTAATMTGFRGKTVDAIPKEKVADLIRTRLIKR